MGAIAITCPIQRVFEKCISKCKSPEHPEKSASDSADARSLFKVSQAADPEREGKYRPYNRTNASVFRSNLLSDRFRVKQKLILF